MLDRDARAARGAGRDRLAARQPDLRPGLDVPAQRPEHRRRRQRRLADFQGWLDRNGINVQVKKEGQTALQTLGDQRARAARAKLVTFTRDAMQTLVEAALALILVIVLSVYMLLYGERIGAAVARAWSRRRRDARRTTSRRASRPRCSATSAASCCSRLIMGAAPG